MKTDTKYCKITGKQLDPETQKRTGNGLFISTAVRTLFKQHNKDVEEFKG
jgi:hypothetical protein